MDLDSYNCALCNMLTEESAHHLFLDCSFARLCWANLGIDIPFNVTLLEALEAIKEQLSTQFFMEAIILSCWTIWTVRNELIFNGLSLTPIDGQRVWLRELSLLKYRVKPGLQDQLSSWTQSLQ